MYRLTATYETSSASEALLRFGLMKGACGEHGQVTIEKDGRPISDADLEDPEDRERARKRDDEIKAMQAVRKKKKAMQDAAETSNTPKAS